MRSTGGAICRRVQTQRVMRLTVSALSAVIFTLFAACVPRIPTGNDRLCLDATIRERFDGSDNKSVTARNESGTLTEHRGWVYYRRTEDDVFTPIVSGVCPQWKPSLHGDEFYVFLPLGYDGASELWIASINGRLINKACEGRFGINSSPIISPDGKQFVHIHRPLISSAGNIAYLEHCLIPTAAEDVTRTSRLFTAGKAQEIDELRFVDDTKIEFYVRDAGQSRGILKQIDIVDSVRSPVQAAR